MLQHDSDEPNAFGWRECSAGSVSAMGNAVLHANLTCLFRTMWRGRGSVAFWSDSEIMRVNRAVGPLHILLCSCLPESSYDIMTSTQVPVLGVFSSLVR